MNDARYPLSVGPAEAGPAPAESGLSAASGTSGRLTSSVPPPTDEIDADWGSEDATENELAQLAAPSSPVANPLRRHTLLGISPPSPTRATSRLAELEDARSSSAPPRPASQPPRPVSQVPRPLGGSENVARRQRQDNPLRKRTLIGILPPTGSEPSEELLATQYEAEAPRNVDRVPTDAPTTSDLQAQVVNAISLSRSQSTTPREFDVARETPPTPPRRFLVAGAVAAAVALSLVGIAALGGRSSPPSPTPLAASVGSPPREGSVAAANGAAMGATAEPASSGEPNPQISQPAPAATPRKIQVITDPEGARIFWKGKDQGSTPVTLELPSGTRRAYEVEYPGYITRKLVVDGSQSEIKVGLRALPAARARANARK